MESVKAASLFLRGTSAVSLDERFSQMIRTQSSLVTLDPSLLQQSMPGGSSPLVLLLQSGTARLQTPPSWRRWRRWRRRRSVWSRLGWRQVTRRHLSAPGPTKGFWSFRNKYRRRAWLKRCARWRPLMRRGPHRLTAGRSQLSLPLQKGGVTSSQGRDLKKAGVPTRKQLDAQLDDYMSVSKSRLDRELDEYMSLSRRRLDAQLDDYMSAAGRSHLHWD